MKYHPLAEAFPSLTSKELQDLSDDIKANGLRDPIVLYEEMILDGRHRYTACLMADVEPRFEEYEGPDPAQFVLSRNHHRRHESTGQRATTLVSWQLLRDEWQSSRQLADQGGVPLRQVERAVALVRNGSPETIEAVKSGDISIHEGVRRSRPKKKQDAKGNDIPVRLQPVFEDQRGKSIAKRLLNIAEDLRQLADSPAGACFYLGSSVDDLKAIAQAVQDTRPYEVCNCRGKGCGRCGEVGWLPRTS